MLFERLRELRKRLADERGVPPYIVFSDVALRQMARFYPATGREFARISGVGERKLAEFGPLFLAEIDQHVRLNPRQMFADETMEALEDLANSTVIALCEGDEDELSGSEDAE